MGPDLKTLAHNMSRGNLEGNQYILTDGFWLNTSSIVFMYLKKNIFTIFTFNPISAWVLENQDMLGVGVNLTPPPLYIPCLMSKYDK